MSETAATPGISRRAWVMIVTGALIVTLSMGVRQAFGLFLRPIGIDLEIDRRHEPDVAATQVPLGREAVAVITPDLDFGPVGRRWLFGWGERQLKCRGAREQRGDHGELTPVSPSG